MSGALAGASAKAERHGYQNRTGPLRQSTWIIRKHFNVVMERTVRELRGEPCLDLEEFAPVKQEIVCSRSFGERITDYEQMRQAICSYAARGAEKLRGEHQYCRLSPLSSRPLHLPLMSRITETAHR